ncbi:MAG: hypothetical protein OHK0039_04620 [Bacteroidia bacterium]
MLPAQDLHQTLAFASQRYAQGDAAGALRAYRRALFFAPDSLEGADLRALADCYVQLGEPGAAQRYLDLAYARTRDDSLRQELLFQKALAYILAGQYDFALIELYTADAATPYFARKQAFFEGVVRFQKGAFAEAEQLFLRAIDSTAYPQQAAAIHALFRENERLQRFKPSKVRWMSIIFPGLGQLYLGEYRHAVNSLVLTGGLIVLFGYASVTLTFVDAMISVMPWFQRYYAGGYQLAYTLAGQKIQRERSRIYQALLDQVAAGSE